jgi:CRISPR-associated protein Cst1
VVEDIIKTYHENWIDEKVSIRAYHFSNFGQSPSLEIYDLPASVFTFMAFANQKNLKAWKKIVRKGYGNIEKKTRDDYKNYKNMVYERLLGGVPIISYFIENETKSVTGDWELLKFYLKEVLFMEEKRIDAIRKLGDDISIIIKSSPNGKRRLGDIERSKTYADFRTVLFRLTKDNVILKNDSPLVTLDDYAKFLFPDGALGWKETQDLLLFKLYENLHGWLINEGIAIETEEDEEDLHSNAQKKEE